MFNVLVFDHQFIFKPPLAHAAPVFSAFHSIVRAVRPNTMKTRIPGCVLAVERNEALLLINTSGQTGAADGGCGIICNGTCDHSCKLCRLVDCGLTRY